MVTGRRTSPAARATLVVVSTALSLLVAEVTMRILGRGDPLTAEDLILEWTPSGLVTPAEDPAIALTLAPGYRGALRYRRATDGVTVREVPVRIDDAGMRVPVDAATAAPGTSDPTRSSPRLLAVGDSMTFGQGVLAEEAWPAVTGARLGTTVLNAGVPTWNLDQAVRWTEAHAPDLRPDIIVVGFYVNDLQPMERPAAPNGLGTIRLTPPPWATWEAGLRRRSFLLNEVARWVEARQRAAAALGTYQWYPEHLRANLGTAPTLHLLDWDMTRLGTTCDAAHARCLVVLIPLLEVVHVDPMVDLLGLVGRAAAKHGVAVVDATPALAGLSDLALPVEPGDFHPSAAAHRAIARVVSERLAEP